jgi:hypothetical protein
MKTKSNEENTNELRPEYDLQNLLKDGVQGKYAKRFTTGVNMIKLDSDVSEYFPTEQSVNDALRLVIQLTKLQTKAATASIKDE